MMLASFTLSQFAPRWGDGLFIVTTLIGLWPVTRGAWQRACSGSPFTIETLMSIAAAGALLIGAHAEAAMVVLLFLLGEPLGALALRDNLRSDAQSALAALNKMGVESLMLTGDNPRAAAAIAHELNIDFRAGLLPADKVDAIRELGKQNRWRWWVTASTMRPP